MAGACRCAGNWLLLYDWPHGGGEDLKFRLGARTGSPGCCGPPRCGGFSYRNCSLCCCCCCFPRGSCSPCRGCGQSVEILQLIEAEQPLTLCPNCLLLLAPGFAGGDHPGLSQVPGGRHHGPRPYRHELPRNRRRGSEWSLHPGRHGGQPRRIGRAAGGLAQEH